MLVALDSLGYHLTYGSRVYSVSLHLITTRKYIKRVSNLFCSSIPSMGVCKGEVNVFSS